MKLLFYLLLTLSIITSCARNEPAPSPTLTGGKWLLKTQRSLATPEDGTPPSTSEYPVTEEVLMSFPDDTHFTIDITDNKGSGRHFEASYTYQAPVLTFPAFSVWNMPPRLVVSRTFQVVELSAHTLIIEWHWKSINIGDGYYIPTNYTTTETYTRQ